MLANIHVYPSLRRGIPTHLGDIGGLEDLESRVVRVPGCRLPTNDEHHLTEVIQHILSLYIYIYKPRHLSISSRWIVGQNLLGLYFSIPLSSLCGPDTGDGRCLAYSIMLGSRFTSSQLEDWCAWERSSAGYASSGGVVDADRVNLELGMVMSMVDEACLFVSCAGFGFKLKEQMSNCP